MNIARKVKWKHFLLGILGLFVFFMTWELSIRLGFISNRTMALPTQVFQTFLVKLTDSRPDGGTLPQHLLTSFTLAVSGFGLAVLIGVPLGLFMGYFKAIDRYVMPVFEIMRPIPPIAWIPIVIIVLGIGMTAKIFIIFVASFVACVINSYLGIKLTNQVHINVAKTSGASEWQIFTTVCIPSSLPMVFAGIRYSLGGAWGTLVAAEMLASTNGLGFMIQMGRLLIRPDIVIVGMLTIGLTGALLAKGLASVEDRIIPWRTKK